VSMPVADPSSPFSQLRVGSTAPPNQRLAPGPLSCFGAGFPTGSPLLYACTRWYRVPCSTRNVSGCRLQIVMDLLAPPFCLCPSHFCALPMFPHLHFKTDAHSLTLLYSHPHLPFLCFLCFFRHLEVPLTWLSAGLSDTPFELDS